MFSHERLNKLIIGKYYQYLDLNKYGELDK